ncbi:alkaline shock response membrane anchor protein AmaP [Paenibacillus cisolokensis]|uniref:alkaline shock response membrane anchor protein AmaP n=1 Tax=Paenibacillus TaxID=44249 RepID=UPI000720D7A8|nr:alkaline shock response membrane anchor protein AmaP [Paenibacillus sp. 32O-W]ALS28402.1 hypothetical protein IJ21_30060 [Paenibacillus sp. 32O-W]
MAQILDRLLLFLYSLVVGMLAAVLFAAGIGWIPEAVSERFVDQLYTRGWLQLTVVIAAAVTFIVSFRLFYVSLRRSGPTASSIDQRTEYGDIRISLETVENIALKAAARHRGVKDLKARIRFNEAGLDIVLRAVVDGETPIPVLTEDMQKAVKEHVEEVTGIPVAGVGVFVANVIQSGAFKSRVE